MKTDRGAAYTVACLSIGDGGRRVARACIACSEIGAGGGANFLFLGVPVPRLLVGIYFFFCGGGYPCGNQPFGPSTSSCHGEFGWRA